ncbi:MAG: hypothetical protein FGO69_10980 [Methanobacterium sp.]|nr:MAG: hypothetical protein FGO69_10980 [Methanobacterium sp.]
MCKLLDIKISLFSVQITKIKLVINMSIKAIIVVIKCEHCGKETKKIIPLIISDEDWRRTQKEYGEELITHIGN